MDLGKACPTQIVLIFPDKHRIRVVRHVLWVPYMLSTRGLEALGYLIQELVSSLHFASTVLKGYRVAGHFHVLSERSERTTSERMSDGHAQCVFGAVS